MKYHRVVIRSFDAADHRCEHAPVRGLDFALENALHRETHVIRSELSIPLLPFYALFQMKRIGQSIGRHLILLCELGLQFGRYFEIAAHYDHRPGLIGKAVGARAQVVFGRRVLAAALIERFGLVSADDLGRGEGLLASVEIRVRPSRHTYLLAQYSRLMHLRQTTFYRPLDLLNVAFGAAWGY